MSPLCDGDSALADCDGGKWEVASAVASLIITTTRRTMGVSDLRSKSQVICEVEDPTKIKRLTVANPCSEFRLPPISAL